MEKHLLASWVNAAAIAATLMERLRVFEDECTVNIIRIDGEVKRGWRVVVVRYIDGMTSTEFVAD